MRRVIITGGAGFIGSNLLHYLVPRHPEILFINVDSLTYAANPLSLNSVDHAKNYVFERVDIADYQAVTDLFTKYRPHTVLHLAAESHVDRSIAAPAAFVKSNIVGTFNLLECFRRCWEEKPEGRRFHHVSTDEVFGSLGEKGLFTEETKYDPSSPYAASKASSDHLARAYFKTYGMPVTISNCSNNYGPRQFPEKLIPLMIINALEGRPLPIYGQGGNVRDWLYVQDHCEALWLVAEKGRAGETYNIGGNNERRNIEVVRMICRILAEDTDKPVATYEKLITYVADRPGHDLRYAIDASKIRKELGWEPRETFETGLRSTVRWYWGNKEWIEKVKSGEYRQWISRQYGERQRL